MLTDYIPQKQGLRQIIMLYAIKLHILTDYIPQKQGLRLSCSICLNEVIFTLTDYIPQKQGLRQTCIFNVVPKNTSQTIFHKNKD